MLEERLVKLCAPTLAGIKTGSLFNTCGIDDQTLAKEVARLKPILAQKGLTLVVFERPERRTLCYLYREAMLQQDLAHPTAQTILKEAGYTHYTPKEALCYLRERLKAVESFPHEIGLFLSYPPEDVKSFMIYGSKCCLFSGYWCVFSEAEQAKACFARFDRCRLCYERRYARRKDIAHFAVATRV